MKVFMMATISLLAIAVSTSAGASPAPSFPDNQRSGNTHLAQTSSDSLPNFSDGMYEVGIDIQPGTYRTRVAAPGCYYARLSGFGGEVSDILANDLTDYPAIVDIQPTDKGFESTRCGTWTQDLSRITTSTTSFPDGTYFVGTDIEPGTYRNSGGEGCYYARLNGFSGTIEDIISNEITDAPAIVTIENSDIGFASTRCGSWSKR